MKKNLIFVLALPPDPVLTQESLEAAMVAAVFEQKVSILFREAAVTCLRRSEGSDALSQVRETIQQLPDYGIDHLYACADSLQKFKLERSALELNAVSLDRSAQVALLASQDAVVPG